MNLEQVRAQAEQYAAKYNPEKVAPFPYENILDEHPDLQVYFAELEDDQLSGSIIYKDNTYHILVNTTKPETRQHFSLAHELGHYFLHQAQLKTDRVFVDGDQTLDMPNMLLRLDEAKGHLETEANNFAASLIMPADLVQQAWEATHNIEACARIFQVSAIAMSIRLTKIGMVSE